MEQKRRRRPKQVKILMILAQQRVWPHTWAHDMCESMQPQLLLVPLSLLLPQV
jgi:hypothetical protein